MTPIIKYLEEGIVPSDKNEARSLRAKISQYVIESGVLFKKGYLVPDVEVCGSFTSKLRNPGNPHGILWNAYRPKRCGHESNVAKQITGPQCMLMLKKRKEEEAAAIREP
ncbi:hypothetical protein Tco_1438627 [Tanacetum coccineum]